MPTVFSGMQPTGIIHIGNYLGALRNFVRLQEQYDTCLYCLVDMHAITAARIDGAQLRHQVRLLAASYLACGLDPERSTIFVQSSVPEHAQLAWILSCVARVGWLARMTQFKEKAGKDAPHASVGLYTYPILMAADILLYQAKFVPVGDDQKQHLELARDIAQKFNNDFHSLFTLPEPIILTQGSRIYSLRDATKKMSKSDPSPLSYINLLDDDTTIITKVRKAKTDVLPMPSSEDELAQRPEVCNLLTIASALQEEPVSHTLGRLKGASLASFKEELADLLVAHIAPIRTRISAYMERREWLDALLVQGGKKARLRAGPFYADVARHVGFAYEEV